MNKLLLYLNLNKLLHIAFVLPLCLACSSGNESNISTYLVERGDFQYVLRVDGVVEPVKFTTVKCPERVDATVTFIVDEGQRVDKGDTLCVLEDADLASLYDQLLLDLEEEEGSLVRLIASNEVDNATLRSEFKTNEAETRIAQLDSLQLKYLPPAQKRINELELDKVLLQRKKLEGKLKLNPVVQQTEGAQGGREIPQGGFAEGGGEALGDARHLFGVPVRAEERLPVFGPVPREGMGVDGVQRCRHDG